MKNRLLATVAAKIAACLSVLGMINAMTAATTPERSGIEERYKWDLSKMYATPEEWDAHYRHLESMIGEFATKKGAGQSAEALSAALKLRDQVDVQLQKLSAYAALKRDEDMRVPAAQALFQRAQSWNSNGPSLFVVPTGIVADPEARLKEWLRQPELSVYRISSTCCCG